VRTIASRAVRLIALTLLAVLPARESAAQLNENCTVSVLNRNVRVNPDGTWILPNIPANLGPVRARATCVIDGRTISGESAPFLIPANGAVNVPPIVFGDLTPIPASVAVTASPTVLTELGSTLQLTVTASYADNHTADVTAAASGTQYTISNQTIATVSGNGLVTAIRAGTVLVQATHEGASGLIAIRIAPSSIDSDGDGIPDDIEVALGLNPQDPTDASEDPDRDGLTNLQEYLRGTDVRKADTDGDGLNDGDEVGRGTNPLLRDTDGDGISDGLEVQTGSNPLDGNSYNLAAALSALAITPSQFVLTFNTILGDVTLQLRVTGTLRDGTTIDLTSKRRGTNYTSSNLNVCNFGATDGMVFAGEEGACTITAAVGTFSASAPGSVHKFAPAPRSFVDLGGPGNNIDVSGDHAYVAVGSIGLKVVDVSDRTAPQIVATLNLPGTANDVKLAGTRAYVAAGSAGLHVVDVSNPVSPRLIATFDTGGSALDVRPNGNLVYIADGPGGLAIVDVSTPDTPRLIGALAGIGTANGVDVAGGLALVANGPVLRVVDVSNPANPRSIGTVNLPGDAQDVVARGTTAYVADYTGSLQVVDFTTPTAPIAIGTTPQALGGILSDVAIAGNFVFGADIFFVNGVPIVDITNGHNPIPRAILDFRQFRDDNGSGIAADGSYVYLTTLEGRLYIGQYRLLEDLYGVPPAVAIASPAPGATFVEGETIPVTVVATDDVAVTAVTLKVNGAVVSTDTTAPYQFTVTAPHGAASLTLGASAGDLGNNVGVAADIQIAVTPDPLTAAAGRVVDGNGVPVGGAAVSCLAHGGVTSADGSFAVAGLPTIQPTVLCTADFVDAQGVTVHGASARVPPQRGGVTQVGDIRLLPVPVISAIVPKAIDSFRPPATIRVTGVNLAGATFAFVSGATPIVTIGTPQIAADGRSATLPIDVVFGSQGTLVMTATNAAGASETFATGGNSLLVLGLSPAADADNDGLTNEYELAIGTDPTSLDTDHDGLPDGWEVRFGLNPLDASDAAADADGDGRTNLQESQAGTNPTNPHVVPPAVAAVFPASGATGYPTNGVVIVRFDEPLLTAVPLEVARQALGAALPANQSQVDLTAAAQALQNYLKTHGEGNTTVPGTVRVQRQGIDVAGAVSLSNDRLSITFTPSQTLLASTTFTVTVAGVRDAAGNLMTQAFQSVFTTGQTTDTSAPRVLLSNPSNGAQGVPVNAAVTVQFSKRIDPATLTAQSFAIYDNFIGQYVAGMIQMEASGLVASFLPQTGWAPGRSFSVYLNTDIKDAAGNRLNGFSFSFTTSFAPDTEGPHLLATSPADGDANVPLNAPIVLQFDEAMNTIRAAAGVQVFAQGVPIAGSIALSDGNRRITFTPAAALPAVTLVTIVPDPQLTDVAGNAAAPFANATFTTGTAADNTTPSVTTISPVNGAAGVPTNAIVQLSFSEAINPITVNAATFLVYPQATGLPVAASFAVSPDRRSATLIPAAPLQALTGYYVNMSGIADPAGHATSIFTSFTTAAGPGAAVPTVVAISPADGAANVPLNAHAVVRLSEPIAPVSVTAAAVSLTTGGNPVASATALSADRMTVTLTPAAALTASTLYRVNVSGLTSVAGIAVAAASSTFTTGTAVTGPQLAVSSFVPANGAADVSVTSTIRATFNAPVDSTSITVSTMNVSVSGIGTAAGTYAVQDNVVVFTPASPFPGNATVNVQVSGVLDLAGRASNFASMSFRTAAAPDTAPPTVVSVTPADGASAIGPNAQVVITFSESVNPSTINNSTVALFANGARFGGVSGISADNRTIVVNGGTLPASSVVTVALTSAVQDLSGNHLTDFTSAFSTGAAFDTARPSIVSQRPANGASGVGANTGIVLFVSERLDVSTVAAALHVSQNGVLVDGTVRTSGNGQVIQFQPSQPWAASALIQVFLDTSARDPQGNSMSAYQASFRTDADPQATRPAATAVSPANGASNVPLNPVITIGYSEPLDPATVTPASVMLNGPVGAVAVAVSLDTTGRVIRIVPATALVPNSFYYYQTTAALRGTNGLAPQNAGSWYFYTGTAADTAAPAIRSVTPPAGAVNVGDNARIVVRFSEPVNPLTVNGGTLAIGAAGPVPASVTFGNQNLDVYLEPYLPLADGQAITITIAGITDVAGNAVAATSRQFTVGAGPDVTPPVTLATNPVNGLTGVPINAAVSLLFNEPIDPSSVTTGTFQIYDNVVGQVNGSYVVSGDGRMASFVPSAPFGIDRSHSVYFANQGITDLAGNLANGSGFSNFSFTTGVSTNLTGPQVVAISPADQLTGVSRNAQVVVDFDRPISTLTASQIGLSAGGSAVGTITSFANGDRRVTLAPVNPLAASAIHTITIAAVADLSGVPMPAPVVTQFTTATGVDLSAPQITSISPANGAVSVPTNAVVQLTFSERMNPLTVNGGTFQVYPQATGLPIGGSYAIAGDGRSATFTPAVPLARSTAYYVNVNGVADLTGQTASTFTSFTTAAGPQTGRPAVIAASPTNGATNVPLNARVVVRMSEPLSPLSVNAAAVVLSAGGIVVPAGVALSSDRLTITLTPSAPLAASTLYDVAIAHLANTAGAEMLPVALAFTTGTIIAPPNSLTVTSIVPANATQNVPVNSTVTVTFSTAVDPTSVNASTVAVYVSGAATLAGSYAVQNNAVVFTPANALPGNTTVNVQVSGVVDFAGHANNFTGTSFKTAAAADTTPPIVVSVTPSDGATDVGPNAPVVITFSESLNASTVNNSTVALFVNGARFGGLSSVSADARTITLGGGTWPASSVVTVALTSAVQDVSGNALADFTSAFTTAPAFDTARPSVVGQRPANGASGVAPNTPVVLFVSEPLDVTTAADALHISQNGVLMNGTVQVSAGGQVLQFLPANPWTGNALIQVFLESTARDRHGNAVFAYQGSFRTAPDPLTTRPVPTAVSPVNGASNVPLNTAITIGYNVPLDAATVTTGTVTMNGPTGAVNIAVSLEAGGQVIRIVPSAPLQAGSYYYYQTTTGLLGTNGLAPQSPGSWYFYTGSAADTTAPVVRSVTPPAAAINVGDNARIVVRFTEPVNPLTVNAGTLAVVGTSPVAGALSFANQNMDVYLEPFVPLPDGQVLTVTIDGVTDVAGNPAPTVTSQFAVGGGPDVTPPALLAINPVNGLTGVPTNTVISLLLNEPVDPSSVTRSSFQIYDNVVGQVNGTYAVSSDGRTVTFVPSAALGISRSHSVYFANQGMTDLAGNLVNGTGFSNFSFTTGASATTTAPQVLGISPADQLTDVSRNVQVVIDLDRAIDTLTASQISVSSSGGAVAAITTFANADRRIILTPIAPLAAATAYTVTVGAITDLSGNPLAAPVVSHFTTTTGVDLNGPQITTVSPLNGSTGVPTNALIQLGFSERINPLTMNGSTFQVYPQATGLLIPGSYTVATDGRSATFTPAAPFAPSTAFYVNVNGIADLTGQSTSSFTSFTTGTAAQTSRPAVVTVSPADGTVDVPLSAKVSVLVSAAVSPVTVGSMAVSLSANGASVTGSISISADRKQLTLTPAAPLAANTTYTVFVGGFADVAGNAVLPFGSTFTTGTAATDAGPLAVSSISPANGSQNVAVNSAVVVRFNKAVSPVTVNTNTIVVSYAGVSHVAGAYAVAGSTVTFTPASPFPGTTSISVQVSGVQDLIGNVNGFAAASFVTAAIADTTPPEVTSVTPADGSSDVGLNAQIVVTFSESLNPATVNNNTFALFANGGRFGGIASVSADNRTVVLNGGTLPAASLIDLVVTSAVRDLAGNPLADFESAFTTDTAPDTTRPSIVSQRPANGAAGVSAGARIVLFVSEPLNPATVAGALHVSQDGVLVDGTPHVSGNGQVIQFEPASPWTPNSLIQVFVDGTAQDLRNNALNSYQSSFRVSVDPQTAPPVATAVSPVYGASNVALNPSIAVGYNEPLDPSTVNSSTVTLNGPAGRVNVAVSLDATATVIRILPVDANNNRIDLAPNAFFYFQTTGIRAATGVAAQTAGYWYFYTGTDRDASAPTVRAVTPPAGATSVGDNARIVVRFSEPVNPLTVNSMTIAVTAGTTTVLGSFSFANQNKDVYLEPYAPMPDDQTVTVTIGGVTDISGNPVAASATPFGVAAGPDVSAPIVLAENPVSGLTNVPTNAVVSLLLNEPIDPGSVTTSTLQLYDNVAGQQVAGTYSVSSDGRTVSFAPGATLAANHSHSVYFANQGMTDLSGNLVNGSGFSNFSFTTGVVADLSGPQVTGISPADQLTAVPRNAQVMIAFDRPINTLTASQIALTTAAGTRIAASVTFSAGDTRVTLTPQALLAASASYTVTIGAVQDLSGIALATPVESHFTTGAGADLTPPVVTAVSPANGAQNIPTGTVVQVTFNERMNPLTLTRATFQIIDQTTGAAVAGDVVVSSNGLTAAFIPASALAPSAGYYVQGSGWANLTGQQTSVFTSFRTGTQ
jgi:hypothetical protein